MVAAPFAATLLAAVVVTAVPVGIAPGSAALRTLGVPFGGCGGVEILPMFLQPGGSAHPAVASVADVEVEPASEVKSESKV